MLNRAATLTAERYLDRAVGDVGRAFERLSSGSRLNRPSDDAASLGISMDLKSSSRVYTRGVQNLSDGISYLSVGDAALDNLSGILTRIQELAIQSANGSYSSPQRNALDSEAQALRLEYNRIREVTKFNGRAVFTNDSPLVLQAGFGDDAALSVSLLNRSTESVPTGTFKAAISTATPLANTQGTYGDFNQDGKLDILLVNGANNSFRVHLGNGDGTFSVGGSFAALFGYEPAVGDFNGDSVLDVVIGSPVAPGSVNDNAQVLLGNADGSFKAAVSYKTGDGPYTTVVSDFNNDGYDDFATSDFFQPSVSVFLANADGTFKAAKTYQVNAGNQNHMRVFDVDGDSYEDIVTVQTVGGGSQVYLLRGNADGTFKAKTGVGVSIAGAAWEEPAFGDFDNDGDIDIAISGGTNAEIAVFLNNGDSTFKARVTYAAGANPNSTVIRDIDNDGNLDILSAAGDGRISVLKGNGNGTFKARTSYLSGVSSGGQILAADFNNDSIDDYLVVSTGSGIGTLLSDSQTIETLNGLRPLETFSLATVTSSRDMITLVSSYKDDVTKLRGIVGSALSRLEIASRALNVSRENYDAAYSRIGDADIAEESAKSVAANIRVKTATSILSQASQQGQLVLSLLQVR